jgi:peptidoglycan L-alanyl-D-glutamate endopeptidase CwlK
MVRRTTRTPTKARVKKAPAKAPVKAAPSRSNDPLGASSMQRLKGVHPELQKLVLAVAAKHPGQFIVTEGLRTRARQVMLKNQGKSRTLNSKHLTGHAVDIAVYHGGKISWNREHFTPVINSFNAEAQRLGLRGRLAFGHDWASFPDSPHIQIA